MRRDFGNLARSLISGVRSIKISRVEIFLLISLLIAGSVTILLTPIGGGYDEDQHLLRVWQMSDFVMIPQRMSAKTAEFPQVFFDLSYRRKPLVEPIPLNFWKDNSILKLYDEGYYYGVTWTRSGYSPPLLLPQAMAMRYLGRKFDLPVLMVYYGCRFAGLLSYMVLSWLALRMIPYQKWLFMLLALSPGAIYQASTISADSISNGIGLLFIAGCLALNEKDEMRWKDILFLILLIGMLFMTKPNLVPLVLLPFILIQPGRYKIKYAYILLIISSILLFLIEVIGWNLISLSKIRFVVSDDVSFSGQLLHILYNPLAFLKVIVNDLTIRGFTYITQWIGVYGYDYGNVPALTYIFYLSGIVIALSQKNDAPQPDKKTRIALFFFFLLIYLATVSIFYVTVTAVGEQFIYGMQGRYFTPTSPLLFLPLSGLFTSKKLIHPSIQVLIYSMASILYIAGLFFSFYVTCGASYYTKGLCYQPFYKNYSPLSQSTVPVSKDTILVQEFVPVCNGMTLIQVRINSIAAGNGGQTEFIVRDEDQNEIVIEKNIQNSALVGDSWSVLSIPPDWNSMGKLYTLTIQGVDTSLDEGPRIAYSLRPEYPDGILSVNGVSVEDDLIFQYGCITGLEKFLGR